MNRGPILTTSIAVVLTIGACGGGSERLQSSDQATPTTSTSEAPASPSGSISSALSGRIAFDNHEDVWTIDADGTGLKQLTNSPGFDFDPSWSPDGTQIAFNSNLTGDHIMYIAQADGSNVVDLLAAGEGWQVASSPDGHSILFTSHPDYTDNYTDVYAMDPDGAAEEVEADSRVLGEMLLAVEPFAPLDRLEHVG